ncbi:MAG: hypothetical protein ACK4KV_00155 [Rhodocyclaceae bacterium]
MTRSWEEAGREGGEGVGIDAPVAAGADATALPGVIVLGVDSQIGLAVVRELGERGVRVFGIGRSARAVGLYSRHLAEGFVHAGRDEALLALMCEIARTRLAPLVMTISEGDILFLNRNREHLPGLKLLIPDLAAIERVIDKDYVYARAAELGMRVPRAVDPNDTGGIVPTGALSLPVVLKWAYPNRAIPRLRSHGLTFHKAEYCHSEDALRAALARYAPMGYYPLVQEYAAGRGLGHMIYLHRGEPVLRFQHLRRHEWPPEGGYSTQCVSLPADGHAALMAQSVALLRAVGWDGPAMVEYRYDETSGAAVLMEINGRFWGSLPLAYHAGARFAWLLYWLKGLERAVPADAGEYRAGVTCRFGLPELKRLWRIVFRPGLIQDHSLHFSPVGEIMAYVGYFLNPRNRYYVFSLRDPRPFIQDMLGLLRRAVPGRRGEAR